MAEHIQFGGKVELRHSTGFKFSIKVSGRVDQATHQIHFELKSPEEQSPLIALRIGKLRLELARIEGMLTHRAQSVTFFGLRVRHEERGNLVAPKITLERDDGQFRVLAEGGELKVTRKVTNLATNSKISRPRSTQIPVFLVPGKVQQAFEQGIV